MTAGPAPVYTAVAFPRPASGWLLGQPATGPGPGTSPWRLWRSRDGGLTWQAAGALPGAAGAPLLGFGDASHGWLVVGGVTWRTAVGGASWIRG